MAGAVFCFSLAMGRIIQAGEIHAVKLFPRGSSGVRLDRGSMRQCFLSPLMGKLAFPDSMKCPMCSSVAFGKRIFLYKSFGPYSYIGRLFFSACIPFKAGFFLFRFSLVVGQIRKTMVGRLSIYRGCEIDFISRKRATRVCFSWLISFTPGGGSLRLLFRGYGVSWKVHPCKVGYSCTLSNGKKIKIESGDFAEI